MSKYFVSTIVDGPAMREALGRAYAASNSLTYPMIAHFPNGDPNLDPATWTYWYADPKISADSTQYAFLYDPADFPAGSIESTTVATGYGDVTLPAAVELLASWFPAPSDPGPG